MKLDEAKRIRKVIYRDNYGNRAVRVERPPWKIVIFRKGYRIIKLVWEPKHGLEYVAFLKKCGVKAHLVSRVRAFPPKDEPDDDAMLWCPYCRRWRWFAIPKSTENKTLYPYESMKGCTDTYPQTCIDLEIKLCRWCGISDQDFWVRKYNHLFRGFSKRKNRGRKTRRRERLKKAKAAVGAR